MAEAKTLNRSAGYLPYQARHAGARELISVDTIDPLPGWQPGTPAAAYAAALWPTR